MDSAAGGGIVLGLLQRQYYMAGRWSSTGRYRTHGLRTQMDTRPRGSPATNGSCLTSIMRRNKYFESNSVGGGLWRVKRSYSDTLFIRCWLFFRSDSWRLP